MSVSIIQDSQLNKGRLHSRPRECSCESARPCHGPAVARLISAKSGSTLGGLVCRAAVGKFLRSLDEAGDVAAVGRVALLK